MTKLVIQSQIEQEQSQNENQLDVADVADVQMELDFLPGQEQELQQNGSQREMQYDNLDEQMESNVPEQKSQQKGKKPFQLKGRRGPNSMFHKHEHGGSRPFSFK